MNSTELKIVSALRDTTATQVQIATTVGLHQTSISRGLARLKKRGLVSRIATGWGLTMEPEKTKAALIETAQAQYDATIAQIEAAFK